MNREETLALYKRTQEEGIHVWNNWANKMLQERKKLEETGEWEVIKNEPVNQKTKDWYKKSEINFSKLFNEHKFKYYINLSNCIFPGVVWFEHANINETCEFKQAIFYEIVYFNDTKFTKSTTFHNSIFKNIAFFNNSKFEEQISFSESIFKKNAYFSNCEFYKNANFRQIEFFGYTQFSTSSFFQSTIFYGSKFYSEAIFNNCKFKDATRFDNLECHKYLNFFETKFDHAIGFSNSKFHGDVNFQFIETKNLIEFKNSLFEKNNHFNNSIFYDYVDFSNSLFKSMTNLANCKFYKTLDNSYIQSENAYTLENAFFKNNLPNFIQANFTEAPRLDNIKIEDNVSPGSFKNSITTFIHPDIKARYQALKRLAVQAHDHENEQKFWAGELRSDRSLRNEDGSWNRRPLISAFWWGNIAYEFFSDFGRSIVRPLISLFILLCIMTNIHVLAHYTLNKEPTPTSRTKTHITKQSNLKDCNIRSSAFRVAAKNGAIGLLQNPAKRSTFVRDYTCLYGTYNDNVTPEIPNSIFWIELLHTLFSAILIFLILLGIRNNFKLK